MIFYKKNAENSKKKTPRLALSSRMTAWAIISTQALTPLLFVPNALAKAIHAHSFEPTLNQKDRAGVVRPAEDYFNLPSLGAETNNADATAQLAENYLSNTAIQAGQILSEADVKNASASWARSVGEQAVNQEINNWLNKKGTARVSVGLDRKISGDILIPVMQGADNLFATQFGLRGNEDRNTANLGLIYRQYIGDWMYGINTFYDYDYTGKNRRLGVGGEAWTNYLKLSVNSYYGLTNWHQSPLSSMKDYDERPANGFDIRTEAYLPAYPQLGANLKYEQYIGKGIDLGSGTQPDDLRDNPRALTLGMSYTPVPLVTLKGEHSVGDKKESRMGIDVSYRFGVPWIEQISGSAVNALRSVKGSLSEFVDRNYEIVMQYRKQVLLRIDLPGQITAHEAETITLPLTVLKAKYGLKDVAWTVPPEFISAGGRYSQPALTQLELKMPAFIGTAREYVVDAVATDNNGNRSNIASTVIKAEPSEGVIKDLVISPAGPVTANDADRFTITAQVLNDAGQPVVAQPVTFSIEKPDAKGGSAKTTPLQSESQILESTTDQDGNATVFVRSNTAGERTVTVTLKNGRTASGKIVFIADAATAQVSTLERLSNSVIADGNSTHKLQLTVTDGKGNALEAAAVELSVTAGAILVNGATAITDAVGQAMILVSSVSAGDSTVSARINDSEKQQTVTFVANASTAQIAQGDLRVTVDGAKADGTESNEVQAKVTDTQGNVVPNTRVEFTANNGATVIIPAALTDDSGLVKTRLSSVQAGITTVTANVAGSSAPGQNVETTFVADAVTATIAAVTLNDATTDKTANGKDSFTYTAVIKDSHGNPVPGATVNWSQDKGSAVTLQPAQSVTDAGGKAVSELQSSKTEALQVQVSAALVAGPAVNADKTVNFRQQVMNFHGVIKNAIDGTGLPGASIELFGSQGDTTPLYALTSSSAGAYSFEKIPAEKYYLKVATTGFITEERAIDLSAGVDLEKHYALSPDLNGQSARIVLTWGATPKDLDAHLLVPTEGDPDTLIHVSYYTRQPPGADARLDIDDQSGFGPETITIDKFHTGVYCYYVRKGVQWPEPLSESDAHVSLFLADGTSKTLNIPNGVEDKEKSNWRVFKIDTTRGGVEINVFNDLNNSNTGKCW